MRLTNCFTSKVLGACAVLLLISTAAFAAVPQASHVVLVVEENAGYSSVIGSSSMPYLNSLASQYGLATHYYANTHPSIGNYFEMTTGQIITNNDSFTSTVTVDNLVRHMIQAGKTWKSYAESLPSVGYTGGNTGGYLKRHNPFSYFSDVANSSNQKDNLVPFTQFATDIANGQLPDFSFVVPNKYDDAHDCPSGMSSCTEAQKLANADAWLKKNLAPLFADPEFQKDGLLIITTDEADSGDTTNGGGHVATIVIGPLVKANYKGTGTYKHQNLLKTVSQAIGLTSYPAAAGSATPMSEFFGTSSTSTSSTTTTTTTTTPTTTSSGSCATPSSGVTLCSPTANSAVGSPVAISAAGYSSIVSMKIYVDGVGAYSVKGNVVATSFAMSSGTHKITAKGWTSSGTSYAAPSIYVTVQ